MRILIIRVGAMGDILHALPAVTALRAALPQAHIGWAVEPRWRALLKAGHGEHRDPQQPLIDRLHEVPTRQWSQHPLSFRTLRDILRLRDELRAEQYDLVIDLQGSIRSAVIGRIAAAPAFLGPAQPREPQARFFYRTAVPTHQPSVIDQACELIAAGLNRSSLPPAPVQLPIDRDAAEPIGLTIMAPTAGWGAKQWPLPHFIALGRELQRQGHTLWINTAPHGDPIADELAAALSVRNHPTTLSQLIALTRQATLVIGGDTGPIHLAAALGVPTVALFGPTDPARNGPYFPGARVKILRHPSSTVSYKRTPTTETGLAQITVEEVLKAALELLDSKGA